MNERIRQLAEQALFESDFDDEQNIKITMDIFAELIVRECINVSEAHAKSLEAQQSDPLLEEYEDGIVNGVYEATTAIKEHFGVEE